MEGGFRGCARRERRSVRGRGRRRSLRIRIRRLHRGQETVSPPGQGFHVTRAGGRVSQRFPQFVDRGIQAVVEIHEGVGRP